MQVHMSLNCSEFLSKTSQTSTIGKSSLFYFRNESNDPTQLWYAVANLEVVPEFEPKRNTLFASVK